MASYHPISTERIAEIRELLAAFRADPRSMTRTRLQALQGAIGGIHARITEGQDDGLGLDREAANELQRAVNAAEHDLTRRGLRLYRKWLRGYQFAKARKRWPVLKDTLMRSQPSVIKTVHLRRHARPLADLSVGSPTAFRYWCSSNYALGAKQKGGGREKLKAPTFYKGRRWSSWDVRHVSCKTCLRALAAHGASRGWKSLADWQPPLKARGTFIKAPGRPRRVKSLNVQKKPRKSAKSP